MFSADSILERKLNAEPKHMNDLRIFGVEGVQHFHQNACLDVRATKSVVPKSSECDHHTE